MQSHHMYNNDASKLIPPTLSQSSLQSPPSQDERTTIKGYNQPTAAAGQSGAIIYFTLLPCPLSSTYSLSTNSTSHDPDPFCNMHLTTNVMCELFLQIYNSSYKNSPFPTSSPQIRRTETQFSTLALSHTLIPPESPILLFLPKFHSVSVLLYRIILLLFHFAP